MSRTPDSLPRKVGSPLCEMKTGAYWYEREKLVIVRRARLVTEANNRGEALDPRTLIMAADEPGTSIERERHGSADPDVQVSPQVC